MISKKNYCNKFIRLLKVPYYLIQVGDAKMVALHSFLLPANIKVNKIFWGCHLISHCVPPKVPGSSLSRGSNHCGQEKPGKGTGHWHEGGGGQEEEEGILLDCESVSITSSSTSTGKWASNAANLLGRYWSPEVTDFFAPCFVFSRQHLKWER